MENENTAVRQFVSLSVAAVDDLHAKINAELDALKEERNGCDDAEKVKEIEDRRHTLIRALRDIRNGRINLPDETKALFNEIRSISAIKEKLEKIGIDVNGVLDAAVAERRAKLDACEILVREETKALIG